MPGIKSKGILLNQVNTITTSSEIASARTVEARASRFFWPVLVVILLLGAALRLYGLGDYPQAFNQDEMVLGYDAWSIWTTGRDQHGNDFPVHFQTFNDAVPPVANYLAAPFVGILGLSRFNTILPFALLGIATIGLVGLLGPTLVGLASRTGGGRFAGPRPLAHYLQPGGLSSQ